MDITAMILPTPVGSVAGDRGADKVHVGGSDGPLQTGEQVEQVSSLGSSTRAGRVTDTVDVQGGLSA